MKLATALCMSLLLFAMLPVTGCFDDDSDSSNSSAKFELIGTWSGENVEMTTPDYTLTADIKTTFTNTTFEGTTTITSADPDMVTTNSGEIVSYSNEEDWYIGKLLEDSENSGKAGKYGMTRYTLSPDGKSFTGTSYSYEDTEEEAKASTTIMSENDTFTKIEE